MTLNRTSAKDGYGTIGGTRIGDVTDIQINDSVQVDEGATSDTAGQVDRTAGHQDATGSFTMQEKPSFAKGDEVTLVLYYKTGETAYNGNALITSVQKAIPVQAGTRLAWTVQWGQKVASSSTT